MAAAARMLSLPRIGLDDAIAWAPELVDLSLADVTDAAKLLVGKPAYRRDEIRTPAKYLRTLCKTVIAADRRLREHEALKCAARHYRDRRPWTSLRRYGKRTVSRSLSGLVPLLSRMPHYGRWRSPSRSMVSISTASRTPNNQT